MVRILIADDHAIVREGLKQLFALDKDIVVAGEAANGVQVLEILSTGGIDLLLLDMTMQGMSGANLISRICLLDNPPPILILSMHNEPQVARKALSAGAAGYLTKDSGHEILLAAIHKVASGGHFIEHALAEKLALESYANQSALLHECLSDREMLVFRMIAAGQNLNSVAIDLGISNKTVSAHKANLMRKMSFSSNAQLMRYAIANGIA
ncbi:response regulator UvrY [mine drainage metagenome]|uniref:Response regulator UvrY n=1 Tax=mine drainage metagenome TaxID=410659 RepID=A0A1J5QWU4_9ZZZZ